MARRPLPRVLVATLLLCVGLSSCRGPSGTSQQHRRQAAVEREPPNTGLASVSSSATRVNDDRAAVVSDEPELDLRIRPQLEPVPSFLVEFSLRGNQARAVRALVMTPRWGQRAGPERIRKLSLRDGAGPLPTGPCKADGRVALLRPVKGASLRARYLVMLPATPSRLSLNIEPGAAWAVGHSFLLLPEIAGKLAVRLRWDLGALAVQPRPARAQPAQVPQAACSFGVGPDVVASRSIAELLNSMYAAGPLLVRDGNFGYRLISLGLPAFELDEALRLGTEIATVAQRAFAPTDRPTFSFFFFPRPALGLDHDGVALHQTVSLWFDQKRKLDARLRILLAHEIIHRWIGEAVRLSRADGSDATWFSEGFTTHFARSLLFRERLIEAGDFLRDLERNLGTRAGALSGADGRAERQRAHAYSGTNADENERTNEHEQYARGALYALRVAAQLRQRGKTSLRDLVAQLIDQARRTSTRALPEANWRTAIGKALGFAGTLEYECYILHATEPVEIPAGALGPCFRAEQERQERFELGFDKQSLSITPALVRGLVAGSAAERAGLHNGDIVLSGAEAVVAGKTPAKLRLLVAGANGSRVIRYAPRRWRQVTRWRLVASARCREGVAPASVAGARNSSR